MREIGGYRIVRRIGSGGMGVVYEAVDADGVRVALKLLHPHIAQDPSARLRLAREVELLHLVRGKGVARVLDSEIEQEDAFVVTELVPGPTLEQDVAADGPFTLPELAELGRGLGDALHAIHRVGVVHRDLKPGNVMMSPAGPVIIDFGIAQGAGDTRITESGLVTGTIGFIDPEVIDGATPSHAGDWWAWAAVLVFAATGRKPFGNGPAAAVIKRMENAQVDLEGIEDPLVADALWAALQPRRERRLEAHAVQAVLEGRWTGADLADALAALQLRAPAGRVAPDPTEPLLPPSYAPGAAPQGPQPAQELSPTRALPVAEQATQAAAAPPYGELTWPAEQAWPPEQAWPAEQAWGAPPYGPPPEAPHWEPPAPARPGTVAAFAFFIVAAAGMWPGVATIALAAMLVLTGAVGYASRARRAARLRYGIRRGEAAWALAAVPLHLTRAAVTSALLLALGAGAGWAAHWAAGVFLTDRMLGPAAGGRAAVELWLAFAVGALVSWQGPGSRTLREGARVAVATVLPMAGMRAIVVVLCLTLGVAFVAVTLAGGLGPPTWEPLPAPPL